MTRAAAAQVSFGLEDGDFWPSPGGHAVADSSGMEHLTALDATFLEVEDSDPHVSLAVGGLSIVEGPAPSCDEFISALAERVPKIPRCRQVLRTHPLDLGPPEWGDDAHL